MNGGAVAYLTQSSYGRNKTEITINNYYTSEENPYRVAVTGLAGSNVSAESTTSLMEIQAYYTTQGVLASTTGNISGVYDMAGGVTERVAGYISNGNSYVYSTGNSGSSGNLMGGTSIANTEGYKTLSTRNYTVYTYDSSSQSSTNNWTAHKSLLSSIYGYGDVIIEVSSASGGSYSWNSDYSYFPSSSLPFFIRGGYYGYTSGVGSFYLSNSVGSMKYSDGFRAVLIAE